MSGIWMTFYFCLSAAGRCGRAIARPHQYFDNTGFECHPDKTTVGRVEKGFDWLGVWFDERGPVGIAPRALENHRTRCLWLEEQARRCGLSEEQIHTRVQQYEERWWVWAGSQLAAACGLLGDGMK